MIRKTLIILIFFSYLHSYCQNESAENILERVSKKIDNSKNCFINFSYKINSNPYENGNILINDKKYILEFMGIKQISDSEKVYTIVPENKEIIISKIDEDSSMIGPSNILKFYKKDYIIQFDNQSNKKKGIEFLKLIPAPKNDEISHIILKIDIKKNYIIEISEFRKDNLKNILKINSIEFNMIVSKEKFDFDKKLYKNYYIEEF